MTILAKVEQVKQQRINSRFELREREEEYSGLE